ncbi:MAG TPA: hypothetical protein VI759_00945 [Dehalococcoidia bacterium]|nr:hypothetical protein [Dehalococcoidia bacterium]
MDTDYVLNLDDILHTIETAEVVRFRFPLLFEKRLLIDNRYSQLEGPMICVVNRAGSSEESFRNLKRLRPRFPLPEKMTAIWWPKYINTLSTSGVWAAVTQRIAETGYTDVVRDCDAALKELLVLERQEIKNVLSGEGFQTIWQKSAR